MKNVEISEEKIMEALKLVDSLNSDNPVLLEWEKKKKTSRDFSDIIKTAIQEGIEEGIELGQGMIISTHYKGSNSVTAKLYNELRDFVRDEFCDSTGEIIKLAKKEAALCLLREEISIDIISDATGLRKKEIQKIIDNN